MTQTSAGSSKAVTHTDLPGLPLFRRGKVRDVYDLGDTLLIVATDRISAFDVIMPNGITDKGKILTSMSLFWFELTADIVDNHLIAHRVEEFPAELRQHASILEGRSMLVKKTEPLPIECVARGYLAGSGWTDYQKTGAVCGIPLPEGLKQAQKLPRTIFTPATKAKSGHDENVSFEEAAKVLDLATLEKLRDLTIAIYEKARDYAGGKGIIISDTKFEFGRSSEGIILIDEILTPDSSRFWPADTYEVGTSPLSFDKQFVRDYLETLDWDKTPPGPVLPDEVVEKTREKYLEAYELLTGRVFET
ncbi:MAG: phosphoribosylaminoimidazolesuccinocarboxamide synthase [bacterium]|nr:phosphoribosylaminoimidazolesuccinocarboxamide synthase [bacterium]MDT8395845.1 phosphoribosylaminoimidazolesuccinocarboxamide synthase [bacterium]